jgi:hypothetical protein
MEFLTEASGGVFRFRELDIINGHYKKYTKRKREKQKTKKKWEKTYLYDLRSIGTKDHKKGS